MTLQLEDHNTHCPREVLFPVARASFQFQYALTAACNNQSSRHSVLANSRCVNSESVKLPSMPSESGEAAQKGFLHDLALELEPCTRSPTLTSCTSHATPPPFWTLSRKQRCDSTTVRARGNSLPYWHARKFSCPQCLSEGQVPLLLSPSVLAS